MLIESAGKYQLLPSCNEIYKSEAVLLYTLNYIINHCRVELNQTRLFNNKPFTVVFHETS